MFFHQRFLPIGTFVKARILPHSAKIFGCKRQMNRSAYPFPLLWNNTVNPTNRVTAMNLIISLFLLALSAIFLSYFAYRKAFFSPRANRTAIAALEGPQFEPHRDAMRRIFVQLAQRPFEDVTIISHDGLTLYGRYYHIRDGAPLVIGFHGYRSCAMTDFAGGSELCFELEQNLLLVDQRAHGKSQGDTITFGILERLDCLQWVNYAAMRFHCDILLYGLSMGAATVLMASGLHLPSNVKGIIADCPYHSPKCIIQKVCKEMGFPPNLTFPFIRLGGLLFGRFDIAATTAGDAVRHASVPILIIHGESDHYVPCAMSEDVLNSSPDYVTRHTFPGADHGISYLVDTPRYKKVVSDFIKSVLIA